MKDTKGQPVIRNYKDTLFRKLFSEKTNLLSLYNLITGKNYTDPDLLNIVTLDNAIYMNMKNDLAFLIDFSIYLFEHQSTTSPNMALRYLFYVSKEYEKFINMTTLYSSKQIELPAPHFIVFYNGSEKGWSIRTSKLSDSFKPKQELPNLELIVKEININLGVNDERLSQCKVLFEYMQYIEKVRTYAKSMITALAVRCDEDFMDDPELGDRTKQWFWGMIVNLGLGGMTDDLYDNRLVDFSIDRFLNRDYEPNGRGGLFTIRNCEGDTRNVEIWHQLCWYLNTLM